MFLSVDFSRDWPVHGRAILNTTTGSWICGRNAPYSFSGYNDLTGAFGEFYGDSSPVFIGAFGEGRITFNDEKKACMAKGTLRAVPSFS
jgi:hypothetical protein